MGWHNQQIIEAWEDELAEKAREAKAERYKHPARVCIERKPFDRASSVFGTMPRLKAGDPTIANLITFEGEPYVCVVGMSIVDEERNAEFVFWPAETGTFTPAGR